MKLVLLVGTLLSFAGVAAAQEFEEDAALALVQTRAEVLMTKSKVEPQALVAALDTSTNGADPVQYGDLKCKCVGIEGLTSTADVVIDNSTVSNLYPAEIGSYCNAWDLDRYPGKCDGDANEGWCSKSWCYVDPCACDIATNPTPSFYLNGASYQGNQIFFSYATCGDKNEYNTPPSKTMAKVCAQPKDAAKNGLETCPCQGIDGLGGSTDVTINNKTVSDLYPAELGSSCKAWDEGAYPGKCDGGKPESWCSQRWCYVDVDNCKVPKGPFRSDYLSHGKFQGKPLYYSYVTCGGLNSYDGDTSAEEEKEEVS